MTGRVNQTFAVAVSEIVNGQRLKMGQRFGIASISQGAQAGDARGTLSHCRTGERARAVKRMEASLVLAMVLALYREAFTEAWKRQGLGLGSRPQAEHHSRITMTTCIWRGKLQWRNR